MFNVLLDPLPTEYHGYVIDADFQTGIQISQCLCDKELSEQEKLYLAIELLFPENKPAMEEAVEGLNWFLNAFDHDNHANTPKQEVTVMDFDIDQWRVYAAFLSQYGIDLNKASMHWFVFMGLLSNLEECMFTRVMEIRQKKITGRMSAEEKRRIKEAKRIYAVSEQGEQFLSETEKEIAEAALEEFNRLRNKKNHL